MSDHHRSLDRALARGEVPSDAPDPLPTAERDACTCGWDKPRGPICPDCGGYTLWPDSPHSEGSDEESIRERWARPTSPDCGHGHLTDEAARECAEWAAATRVLPPAETVEESS